MTNPPFSRRLARVVDDHGGWSYHTCIEGVSRKSNVSSASDEVGSHGYEWFDLLDLPTPLHPGLEATLPELIEVIDQGAAIRDQDATAPPADE